MEHSTMKTKVSQLFQHFPTLNGGNRLSAQESETLLAFARALEPHSKALAQDFAGLPWNHQPANPLLLPTQQRTGWGSCTRRFFAQRRSVLGVGLAAALLLAVAPSWQLHHNGEIISSAQTQIATNSNDRIFSWSSERSLASQPVNSGAASDEIFRSDFKGG